MPDIGPYEYEDASSSSSSSSSESSSSCSSSSESSCSCSSSSDSMSSSSSSSSFSSSCSSSSLSSSCSSSSLSSCSSSSFSMSSLIGYTISEFLTHVQAGDPVRVVNSGSNIGFVLTIGKQSVLLTSDFASRLNTNGKVTDVHVDTRELDLGAWFTAQQILDSVVVKNAIESGALIALPGTLDIPLTPTV